MREGWETVRLEDCCTKIGSGATPRGGKEVYLDEGPFSLIRSQNVLDFFFSYNGLAFIDKAQADQLSNVEIKEDDVLLNITGDSVARVCQVPSSLLPARVNQHVSIIRPYESKLTPEFLKYYLLNPKFKNHMLGLASVGGTRNALTKGMIENFKIDLPPLETQRRIAAILSALDDKIELNRQTNQTLEAIAQALFKEWFVEFNFPSTTGEMQESELGPIPVGWRVDGIGVLSYVQNGYAFKSDDFRNEGSIGIIKIKNIGKNIVDILNTQFVDESVVKTLSTKFLVKPESLLIAMTGAEVGKIGLVPFSDNEYWLNQRVGMFVEIAAYSNYYLYILLTSEVYQTAIRNSALGSAQPNISSSVIENIKAIIPSNEILITFGVTAKPLIDQILYNISETHLLSNIRDQLLPKMMNGEIEV